MAFTLTTATKNAMLDAAAALTNNGLVRPYAGSVPADANAALGGATLLGTITLGATAFASASGGSITLNASTRDEAADATGTASFFRIFRSDGTTVVFQGTITATGGGGDMTLPSTSITAGQPIEVTSIVISL